LVLASIARRLAYDVLVRPVLFDQSPEDEASLTLTAIWLAHHMTGHEAVPATLWLDEALARDGLDAIVDYLTRLRALVPAHLALEQSFRPETVASIVRIPDYFGWLILGADPAGIQQSEPTVTSRDGAWLRPLINRFDVEADPWASDGRVYLQTAPAVIDVRYGDGWAVASTDTEGGWPPVYYFRTSGSSWVPSRPEPDSCHHP
jgi:hypothetical protein